MLESLGISLCAAALVAAALAAWFSYARSHPFPVTEATVSGGGQAPPLFALISVMASAAGALVCFVVFGMDYASVDIAAPAPEDLPFAMACVAYLVACAAIGFYEEGAFRVILHGMFARGFLGNGAAPERCGFYAALLAGVFFAIMHVMAPVAAGAGGDQIAVQVVLKFAQGFLFSMTMAALLRKTHSFALIVTLHGVYDMVVFLPWLVTSGGFPDTYLTGQFTDTAALVASCVLLLPAGIAAIRFLACGGAVQGRTR